MIKRAVVATISAFTVSAALIAPAAYAGPPAASSPAGKSAETGTGADTVTAAKKKTKKVKKVTLKANHKKTTVDGIVKLTGQVKPKQKAHVGFQQKFPGSKKWHGAGTKVTKKSGKASVRVQLGKKGTFKYRMVDKKKTSKVVKVQAISRPTPPPPPPPPVEPKAVTATWPNGQLAQDKQYSIPVQVRPAVNVQVKLQSNSGSGWDDLYGGSANTGSDGAADLVMSVPATGDVDLRAVVTGFPVTSDPQTRNFTDKGDALYGVPLKLPNQTGQIVKAQEFPLTYPHLNLPDPLKAKTTTPDQAAHWLTLPQIGTPASGPPECMTKFGTPRADCPIPGKQYRIMYTTERWYPNEDGTGSAKNGTVAATGLLLVPPNVSDNAPVVVWAHPTLGQEDKCSVSRGVDQIEIIDGKTGAKTMGPGGLDINLTDASFFLNQMLEKGYVVVMPDYLGIAVDALDANQTMKTYAVGPQEARDVFFAAQALFDDPRTGRGWPGLLTSDSNNKMVVAGHSQGGHAALWTGSSADTNWAKGSGMDLKGVISVAPATDLNKLVDVQWNNQANWVIGPEIIQTWAGYLPVFALQNNTLSDASNPLGPNPGVLDRYEGYCTTQAFAASTEFFPNGLQDPNGVPFMKNPDAPANQQSFSNWGQIFNGQTPVSSASDNVNPKVDANIYPKNMPTQLISGTADQVVLSQVNAAMQENFCSAGVNLAAYWTPVTTGVANPNPPATDAFQAADHLNVLAFPFANNVGTGSTNTYQLAGGTILQFTADRFAGKNLASNCADRQTTHTSVAFTGGIVDTWYIFPKPTSGTSFDANKPGFYQTEGSPKLPNPSVATPPGGKQVTNGAPALGTVDINSISQTGCGFTYEYDPKAPLGKRTYSNPNCTQWGLYPYGELIYKGASVDGKTWGGKNYPFVPPTP